MMRINERLCMTISLQFQTAFKKILPPWIPKSCWGPSDVSGVECPNSENFGSWIMLSETLSKVNKSLRKKRSVFLKKFFFLKYECMYRYSRLKSPSNSLPCISYQMDGEASSRRMTGTIFSVHTCLDQHCILQGSQKITI